MNVLHEVREKVMGSSALNGGFESLMFKVNGIEANQVVMGQQIGAIHEAVYRPDDGLFARVKSIELVKERIDDVDEFEMNVRELQQWRSAHEKTLEIVAACNNENKKIADEHSAMLAEFTRFQTRMYAVVKWFALLLIGGMGTLTSKLLYDFVSGHITIH